MRILLALGDAAARSLCERVARERGHEIVLLPPGRPLVAALAEEPFGLVLLDRAGLGTASAEACRRAARARSATEPVIILALPHPELPKTTTAESGADDYLPLPLEEGPVRAWMATAERHARAGAPDTGPPAQGASEGSPHPERLANDLNNALMAIASAIGAASLYLPAGAVAAANELTAAQEAVAHAARLVRQHVERGAGPEGDTTPGPRGPADPGALVERTLGVLRGRLPPRVGLSASLGHGDWKVLAEAEAITSLLARIAERAHATAAPGGSLTIATARVFAGSPDIPARLGSREFVRFDVSDDGAGMPADALPRLFDPDTYDLLRRHDAGVVAESRREGGTVVRIFLPRLVEGARALPEATPRGTLLLVDDDPLVRRPLRVALEHFGHQVVEAADGTEALALHGAGRSAFDLVVLDVRMPGLSGWEVLAELKRRDADLPVLLMSGDGPGVGATPREVPLPDAFLRKPFAVEEARRTIGRLLEARARPA